MKRCLTAAVMSLFLAAGCSRTYMPDKSKAPIFPAEAAAVVAELDHPPGNIAVSSDHRIFFTFHPEADPDVKVAELKDGAPVAYPDSTFQENQKGRPFFDTVLSLRIDRQGRLWTLDFARYGRGQPRLLAFDLETGQVVHQYDFPDNIVNFGSFLNDFQVHPSGEFIYIADTGMPAPVIGDNPALIVYNVSSQTARRVLDGHPSVTATDLTIRVDGADFSLWGIPIHIGVDSIALDREGRWLYYGAVNAPTLYRIETGLLNNPDIQEDRLEAAVEAFSPKTMSDGLTTDESDHVYLSDMEHSAVHRITQERTLETLLKDERFRWPDGFSFGPDGWLYFTCSDLTHVVGRSRAHIADHAPYRIYRFKPGYPAPAGH